MPDCKPNVEAMALKRFKTNKPIWLLISAALFIPPWFIGTIDKHEAMHAAHLWLMLFGETVNFGEVVVGIFSCTLLFGIPALVVGWVLQCLIIMVRDSRSAKARIEPPPES